MRPTGHNPFELPDDRREQKSFAPVEALVRAAGNYVRPGDDLRPRVLEAARHAHTKRQWNKRLTAAAAAVLLLAAGNVPGRFAATDVEGLTSETVVMREFELRQQASKNMGLSFSPAWAWFEAFLELRNEQASRINQ